ncbi:MAG: DUF6088 family protein [Muribaculum sp.]|nr:DUF6088 family protein [Muribaculum sp.]
MSGFESIKQLIESWPRGTIFFPEDFATVGSSDTVRSALVRLCDDNIIVRLGFGVYCYPRIDDKWGMGVLYPSMDNIAQAIAKRDRSQIAPTGSAAMNALGLSTQLQANVVYYTNGSPRKINIGDGKGILFKRTTQMKRFAYRSELMQLIVAALREIGNGKVNDDDLQKISEYLNKVNEDDFQHDVFLAPTWVQKLLKEIR